jgi:DNA-binding NarL/FixJ family response regulator
VQRGSSVDRWIGLGWTATDDITMDPHVPLDLVIVDANRTLRKGTELLLRSWGHHVIGTAGDAQTGAEIIRRRRPHVALVDLELPGGREPVLRAATAFAAGVVLFVGQPARHELDGALRCGSRGLVLKSGDPGELREAIREVGRGERHVAPAVKELVARQRLNFGNALSNREREVLNLLAGGMTGVQASSQLTLSSETVRTHVRNAMRKLGARTRVEAVMMAVARHEIRS